MARSLTTYTMDELTDLTAQGYAMLPALATPAQHEMIDVIARITAEIARRNLQAIAWKNLPGRVCGYAEDGSLLPAIENHRFAHIARSRR